ncbi:MAG: hypothetical protein ABJB11_00195 [Ferruginibacter sp.]
MITQKTKRINILAYAVKSDDGRKRPNTLKPGTNYYDFFWEAQNLETLMIPVSLPKAGTQKITSTVYEKLIAVEVFLLTQCLFLEIGHSFRMMILKSDYLIVNQYF